MGRVIDRRLNLGIAGYGFTSTPEGPSTALGTPREFRDGVRGFQIRYAAFLPDVPVYASIGMLLGGGSVVLTPDHDWEEDWQEDDDDAVEVSDGYFVIQPRAAAPRVDFASCAERGICIGFVSPSGASRI